MSLRSTIRCAKFAYFLIYLNAGPGGLPAFKTILNICMRARRQAKFICTIVLSNSPKSKNTLGRFQRRLSGRLLHTMVLFLDLIESRKLQ